MNRKVSIIVPCYNEEEGIRNFIEKLEQSGISGEVLFVNDGSTDRTEEMIRESIRGKKGPLKMKILSHRINRGYGAAIKTGLRHAEHEIVGIIDADGTYDPHEFAALLPHIEDNDMVVGSRNKKNAKVPLIRRPAKFFLSKLANYLAGYCIPDLNSGMRLFKKNIAEKFYSILPNGFSLTTTITLAMVCYGFSLEFVPIAYRGRQGKSKIRPVSDTINFIVLILKTITYFNPLRIFIPISIFLFLAAMLVLGGSIFLLGQVMDITVIVLSLASLQVGLIGLVADLIVHGRRME